MSASVAAGETAYEVRAFNTAAASENKIHDDAVARRFGFGGGLVPGVDVYAYMAHLPAARWGHAWLEHGAAECRFQKPVYDGDIATVTATETAEGLDLPPPLLDCIGQSAEEIAELICRLYQSDTDHERYAEAGLRFVRRAFSARRIDRLMRAATEGGGSACAANHASTPALLPRSIGMGLPP